MVTENGGKLMLAGSWQGVTRAALGALTGALVLSPSAMAKPPKSRSAGATAHHFVALEPRFQFTPPVHGVSPFPPEYLDVASLRKAGDRVTFDLLTLNWSYNFGPAGQSVTLRQTLAHDEYSCSWQTIQMISPAAHRTTFGAYSGLRVFLERACAGQRQAVTEGFASASAAHDAEFSKLAASGSPGAPLMPVIASRSPPPPPIPVLTVGDQHRFVQILDGAKDGRMLFMDWSSLQRSGDTVTALSLAVLGPDGEKPDRQGDGAEARLTHYDCSRKTLQVLQREDWLDTGEFDGQRNGDPLPRAASQSPAMTVELRAVCSPGLVDRVGGRTVKAAWDFARSRWTPPAGPNTPAHPDQNAHDAR